FKEEGGSRVAAAHRDVPQESQGRLGGWFPLSKFVRDRCAGYEHRVVGV
ncbi:hypothetical protein LCGC14_2961120, partial [marine sediment metagenome]